MARFSTALGLLLFSLLLASNHTTSAFSAEPENANQSEAASPGIPPVPNGTPKEMLDYIRSIRAPAAQPTSREEMMKSMQAIATATVEAADRALSQLKDSDDLFDEAATAKLQSLMMLGRLGDTTASSDLQVFAQSLIEGPSPALAVEAKRLLLVQQAQELFTKRDLENAPAIIKQAGELLSANPDDAATAGLAMQLASAFEHMPGGEALSKQAYETFGPIFAKSKNDSIRQMAESFQGTLRRLALPGNPMKITGTLLNGQPFDQSTLAGKIVLVDFWATWCGPCIAEIPNVLEQYQKYHSKGFEVVGISLDQERDALEKFVTERKIPWPILFEPSEGSGWQHPLASYYGISGIPTVILIGKDGNVVSLNARGERLGELLDELFKDSSGAGGS
ncbi:MAG: TlpA disulfide reductase family protein [Pirellulales bacterium]|jgi:thiol-disulfide isomerase/thioredoxin